jgi:DNA-binding transcriptional LysR family regulator
MTSIATQWLMRRLPFYGEKHPEIDLWLQSSVNHIDLGQASSTSTSDTIRDPPPAGSVMVPFGSAKRKVGSSGDEAVAGGRGLKELQQRSWLTPDKQISRRRGTHGPTADGIPAPVGARASFSCQ